VTYWDSSAILKLYITEPDSAYFLGLAGAKNAQVHSSAILRVEALSALARKERAGEIQHGAAGPYQELVQDISAGLIMLVPFDPGVIVHAERLVRMMGKGKMPRILRSLDLIHLASALQGNADSFVATDIRLRQVASMAGLKVLP
jgi:predicted nucleic acid-binding protein